MRPDVPADRFFAMTRLDENRAKAQLAARAGVAVSEVQNLAIWGNHSATQYPDFNNATIAGKPVTDVIDDVDWLQGDFISTVQKAWRRHYRSAWSFVGSIGRIGSG